MSSDEELMKCEMIGRYGKAHLISMAKIYLEICEVKLKVTKGKTMKKQCIEKKSEVDAGAPHQYLGCKLHQSIKFSIPNSLKTES